MFAINRLSERTGRDSKRAGRRTFLSSLVALPLVLAGTLPGWSQESAKVRIGILGASSIAVLVADEEGFFKENKLDVEIVPLQSGPASISATTSGSVDVSYGDILAWIGGLGNGFTNVRLIAPGNGPAASSLLVKADSPIQDIGDLKGKRVGTPAAPAFSIATKIWLAENGLGPDDVQFVVVPPSTEGQTLATDGVDAVLAFADLIALNASRQTPVRSIADPVTAAVPAAATFASYYANAAFIDANPEVVERLAAALHRGAETFNGFTPEEKLAFNGRHANWDIAALTANHPGFLEKFRFTEVQVKGLDLEATQQWADKAFDAGGLPKRVDISEYIHSTAVSAASQ